MNKEWFNKIDEDKIILPKRKNNENNIFLEDDYLLNAKKEIDYLKVPEVEENYEKIKNVEKVPETIKLEDDIQKQDQNLESLKKLSIDLEIEAKKTEELRKLKELQQRLNKKLQEQEVSVPKIIKPVEEIVVKDINTSVLDVSSSVKPKLKPKPIFYGILVVSFLAIIISGYKIINWYIDSQALNKQIKEITSTTDVVEVDVNTGSNIELVNEP